MFPTSVARQGDESKPKSMMRLKNGVSGFHHNVGTNNDINQDPIIHQAKNNNHHDHVTQAIENDRHSSPHATKVMKCVGTNISSSNGHMINIGIRVRIHIRRCRNKHVTPKEREPNRKPPQLKDLHEIFE